MPLEKTSINESFFLGPKAFLPEDAAEEDSTVGQQWDAALRLENSVFSYVNNIALGVPQAPDPNTEFDPFQHLEDFDDPRDFENANSLEDMFAIRAKIEQETQDRRTLGNAGIGGVALAMGSGVLDPINLVPVGGSVVKTTKMGESILKGAGNAARAGLLTGTATELALQSTQMTRTTEEMMANIGATTILSGLVGGGAAALALKFSDDMVLPREGEDLMEPQSQDISVEQLASFGDVGAAKSVRATAETLAPAPTFGIAEKLGAAPKVLGIDIFNTPDLRILTQSKSVNAKLGMLGLYETPLRLKGNEAGEFVNPVPIQRKVTSWNYNRMKAHQFKDEMYLKYRGERAGFLKGTRVAAKDIVTGRDPGTLSKAEFQREIGFALEKGGRHDIPEVAAAAKKYNETIYKPIGEELLEVGKRADAPDNIKRLAKSFEGDDSKLGRYVNRVYNRDAIRANPKAFVNKIADYIRQERVDAGVEIIDELEIQDIAFGVKDRILGLPDGRNFYDQEFDFGGSSIKGDIASSLKSRILGFDNDFMPEFLITDIEHLTDSYTRSVLPDLEMIKEYGTPDGKAILDKVSDDYRQLINNAADEAEAAKLQKQFESDVRDIEVLIDRLRNRFGYNPRHTELNAGISALKSFNIMRFMGGITLASFPDVARIGLTEASMPVFKDSIKILTKPKVFKLARGEAQMMSTAMDIVLEGRAHAFVDIADDLARSSRFGRAMKSGTTNFLHATGITKWNEVWETVSANMVQTKIFQAADAVRKGRASPEQLAQLAEAGIDIDAAKIISREVSKYGNKEGALRFGGYENWRLGDAGVGDAYRKLQSAIQRDVERIIISPGADKPVWLSTPVGSMFGQFKSFGYASLQRSMLLNAQRLSKSPKDFATLSTLVSQISLGMAVTYLRLAIAGEVVERTTGWGPAEWIGEGIDRSGILGVLADGAQIPMKFMGLGSTRYEQRNIVDTIIGPSAGILPDAAAALNIVNPLQEGVTKGDIAAARRLMPFQNYVFFRRLLDEGQRSLADNIASTKRQRDAAKPVMR